MHDIRAIRDDPAAFDRALARRSLPPESARLLSLDERRRELIAEAQSAQERRNSLSKEIGAAKKAKDEARAAALMEEVAGLKERLATLEAQEREAIAALDKALAEIPNILADEVPDGPDESANVERSNWGMPRRSNSAREHFDIGEALGLMDFEIAAKLSGARFTVLKGQLARMERALGQLMIDVHTQEHGYTEVSAPLLVRDEIMFGTAQLPKFEEDQFLVTRTTSRSDMLHDALSYARDEDLKALAEKRMTLREVVDNAIEEAPRKEDYWLVPTAEVSLTNLVRDSILSEDELPLRFTALTPCFRAEAGSAGRDTRGMLRQHQFWKCELVSITTPETSGAEHERMLSCAETVLRRLELPYRVMTLSSGDTGFAARKTYDIEVWLPGQNTYREISSCSVCGEFQARRMGARFRRDGKPHFVHTLNGSGIAVGRALIAVLETYQNDDGSVTVPSALAPYMGGITRIERV